MQAPFKWILIHAARFQGIIRVNASDGEGYVMVRKGEPMGCMFRRKDGDLLKGKEAYSHITSYPVVNLSILRYSGEEMESAAGAQPVRRGGISDGRILSHFKSPCKSTHRHWEKQKKRNSTGRQGRLLWLARLKSPRKPQGGFSPGLWKRKQFSSPQRSRYREPGTSSAWPHRQAPGVQAVSIFGRGSSVLSIRDVELDSLVVLAEDMLEAAKEIRSVMRTGPFVHLTLQIPAGKVIIAPYFNEMPSAYSRAPR